MRKLVLVMVLFLAGCATQSFIAREDAAKAQLAHALDQYIVAHPGHPYPATKQQLVAFAAAHSLPLDLSWVTGWRLVDRDTLMVGWKSESNEVEKFLTFSTNPI